MITQTTTILKVLVWFAGPTRCPVRLLTFQAATQLLTAKTTLFCWIGFYVMIFALQVFSLCGFRVDFVVCSDICRPSLSSHPPSIPVLNTLLIWSVGLLALCTRCHKRITCSLIRPPRLALAVPMSGLGSSWNSWSFSRIFFVLFAGIFYTCPLCAMGVHVIEYSLWMCFWVNLVFGHTPLLRSKRFSSVSYKKLDVGFGSSNSTWRPVSVILRSIYKVSIYFC